MATTVDRPAPADPAPGLSQRDEIAMALFGTWAIVGLYLDGWAHRTDQPETFFTPWHLVLYSGVGAAVAWFTLDGIIRSRKGAPSGPDDRIVGWGLGLFGLGAVGDFAWHAIFGIEENLEALLSPTHLALMIGGVMMVSAPIRMAWSRLDDGRPTMRTFWPTVVSVMLATAVVSFFFMYLTAFQYGGLAGVETFQSNGLTAEDAIWTAERSQVQGLTSVLFTNLFLLAPTLLIVKRWRTPFGTFTLMYTVLALLMNGMTTEFQNLPVVATGVVGGLAADVLADRIDAARSRLFAAGVPLVMWSTWFVALHINWGVEWPAELVAGTVILATLAGLMLQVLMSPMPIPERRPTDRV